MRRISYPTRCGCRSKTVTFKARLSLPWAKATLKTASLAQFTRLTPPSIHQITRLLSPRTPKNSRYRSHFLIPIPRMLFCNQTSPPWPSTRRRQPLHNLRVYETHPNSTCQRLTKMFRHNSDTDFLLLLLQTCTSPIPVSVTTAKTFPTLRRKKSRYVALTKSTNYFHTSAPCLGCRRQGFQYRTSFQYADVGLCRDTRRNPNVQSPRGA